MKSDKLPERGEIVIDASGCVVGRLATQIAKILLKRPKLVVKVINVEKAVITGDREMVVNWFLKKISEWRTHYNPKKVGPKVPRRPDRVFKRVVRGMLPKGEAGRWALKRLKVYVSTPLELIQRETYKIPTAKIVQRPLMRYVTLEEVWRSIDPSAWEQWKKAQTVWEKRIKQITS